jgi:type VI protein secretion system component Hcp
MTRHIIVLALVALVSLSAIAHADAGTKSSKKGHASMSTITFTKHYDKASSVLF